MSPKVELNKKVGELLVTIVAEKEEWVKSQDKSLKKLAGELTVKGFRKGQAPIDIAKKNLRLEDIFRDALKEQLDALSKIAAKEVKPEMEVIDNPTYRVNKITEEELEITFVYPVYPDFQLPNYKNLNVNFDVKEVTKEDVDREVQRLIEGNTTWENKENGALAFGDKAIFDFEGFIKGKPFEGGKALKYELVIGSKHFIDGFEDQMVGLKVKEERDVNVKFPDNYQVDVLKGKDAIFKVKLHEIKAKFVPKLDDALVAKLNVPKIKTVDDVRPHLENILKNAFLAEAKARFQREIFAQIKRDLKVNLHNNLIFREEEKQVQEFQKRLQSQGSSLQKYQKDNNLSDAQMHAQFISIAEQTLKDTLIFAEIARQEKIAIVEKDFEDEYVRLSEIYGASVDSVKGVIKPENLQTAILNNKVVDRLIELNSASNHKKEVTVDQPKKEAKEKATK